MTLILFSPNAARTTSNSVFSSAGSGSSAAAGSGSSGDRSGGGDAPLLFEHLRQFRSLENGEGREVVYDFGEISHLITSYVFRFGSNHGGPLRLRWIASSGVALLGMRGEDPGNLPAGCLQDRRDTGRGLQSIPASVARS